LADEEKPEMQSTPHRVLEGIVMFAMYVSIFLILGLVIWLSDRFEGTWVGWVLVLLAVVWTFFVAPIGSFFCLELLKSVGGHLQRLTNSANHMHYLWLIPLVVLILLLAAWPFRWVKEATQTIPLTGTTIVHLRDRWTGQRWKVFYGFVLKEGATTLSAGNMEFVSGEALPISGELREAYRNRKIATGVWAGLVGVSLLLTVTLFVRERRLPRPETTPPSGPPESTVRTE
jgi:hypothetical protein